MDLKLDYIHDTPVEAGIAHEPLHYVYSSALNYVGDDELIEVVFI